MRSWSTGQDVLPARRNPLPRATARLFLAGSGRAVWGEVSPASAPVQQLSPAAPPALSPLVKRPHPEPALGLLPSLPRDPGVAAASQRRMRLREENQPQMWPSCCCSRAMSGDRARGGPGDTGTAEETCGWLGPKSPEGFIPPIGGHRQGDSVPPAVGCSPGRGGGATQGQAHPWG